MKKDRYKNIVVFVWVEIFYEVMVYMGDVRGVGINVNVFFVMYGENGKFDQFDLRNKFDNFERGQVDKFKVSFEDKVEGLFLSFFFQGVKSRQSVEIIWQRVEDISRNYFF